MARPRLVSEAAITSALQRMAKQEMTPEAAAADLGVSSRTLLRYVTERGGRVAVDRYILMPELEGQSHEDECPAAATGGLDGPGDNASDPAHRGAADQGCAGAASGAKAGGER
jgi:hypothetical protein